MQPTLTRGHSVRFLLAACAAALCAAGAVATARGRAPADPAPAAPGVFTAAQALRGKAVYAESCAACHGAALEGAAAPPLSGPRFQASWSHPAMTADDLHFIVRTTMPPRGTGSVTTDDLASVTAFILRENGHRAGATPLGPGGPASKHLLGWAAAAPVGPSAPEFVDGDPGAAPGARGPDHAALLAGGVAGDWLLHARDYAGTRFSPLTAINTSNAARLAPACMFQLGETGGFQTGPVVHAGVMYLTTRFRTIAIDAATCRVKWRHQWEPKVPGGWGANRGVAIKDGRVVRGTSDGYLIALSAETGALLWARRVAAGAGETITMAPIVYDDMVLLGPAGSENNIKGWVGAFKLADGSPVWRFNTVPAPGEPGYETWADPKNTPMGGGAVWTSFALDPETGDLHVAAANPAPDLPAHLRPGENLYTNSLVVLDVRTGKRRWHRTMVPNDSHDWDLTHATPLFTASVNGVTHKRVTATGKDGLLRVLDRDSRSVVFEAAVTTRENADVPVTATPVRACPGVLGGVQWNGPSFSRSTGLLYAGAVDWCYTFTAFEEARYIPGRLYMGGTVQADSPDRAQGWITAVDAATGAVKWKYRSPRPVVAAVTATAGNLLLAGELTGDFIALDARSGQELYRFNTGGPMGGGVITYESGGRQYIAVASGSPSNYWVLGETGAPTIVVFAVR